MKQFNIAIIGQGRSGRDIHGLHLKKDTERFRVVAVVEKLEKRMNRAAAEYGCDVYDDYTKLFERNDIDLVVNSSPSHLHYAITKDLLSHGLNVLCEKPCVPTVEEFDDLCETAKQNGCHFLVFQQSRFANYFLKVKEVIASGVLGRIVHVGIQFNGFARRWDWQCCLDFNGGNLANTGPHPVDQALNILDAYDQDLEIFCKMDRCNTFANAEDYVKLIVTAPGKPVIDLDISSCDAYPLYTYKVEGTNGTLKGNMAHIDWKYFKPEEAPQQKLIRTPLYVDEEQMPAYCGEKLTWYEESWDGDPQAPFIAAVQTYYDQIYALLSEGREHDIKLFQVRQQLDLIRKCHEMNPQIC